MVLVNTRMMIVWGIVSFLISISCFHSLLSEETRLHDDTNDTKITDPVEKKVLKVRILGSDDNPVSGATVVPYALRCTEEKGSHFGWPVQNMGAPPKLSSGADGVVEIAYPARFGREPDWLSTCQITFMVTHSQYVGKDFSIDLEEDLDSPTDIQIVAGCEVFISAVDDRLRPVDCGVCLPDRQYGTKWELKDGFRSSRSIPPGIFPAMLVVPQENGQTLFSSIIPLKLNENQTARLRNVPVKKGMRFFGRLSEDVPRPVKNGFVSVELRPDFNDEGKDPNRIFWSDYVSIHEDGTFEFPSLPSSGTMRIISLCDGWMIDTVDNDFFIKGIDIDINASLSEDLELEYELPMQETGNLEITVIRADGEVLAGAEVSTWPNMSTLSGGSTLLGERGKSLKGIELQLGNQDEETYPDQKNSARYHGKTDEEGVVILRDIPLNRNQSFYISHPEYGLPKVGEGGFDRAKAYELKEKGTKKMIVEVVPLKENAEKP